ncbi:hypothetical protein T439DRAFT_323285 [Meredithblackwellia eburnea MCA 4105]
MSYLQLLLSPRPPRTVTATQNPLVYANGSAEARFVTEADGYRWMYNKIKSGESGQKAISTPPLHIHLGQTEHFTVLSGTMVVTSAKSGETELKKGDPESPQPPLVAHTCWCGGEDGLEYKVRVSGQTSAGAPGFGEGFFRNFQSYLNDCSKHNKSPSIPQMFLFLYNADIVLATPLPLFISKWVHWFGGVVVGQWLLGYQAEYPEYFETRKGQ